MKTTKYTFWKLINEYKIEIPIIQRDYAQGRNVDNIPQIRLDFIKSLYAAIEENTSLDFDFVYGSVLGSEDKKILHPLDGQQRLTTLFLLHWYLAVKDGCISENKNTLSGFSYETRISSRNFCSGLVRNGDKFTDLLVSETPKISDLIKDASWFYMSWQNDPTIKAMLVMLDDIHQEFKNTSGFFEKLKRESDSKPPVTFRFLELENFGLDDSLYVKMNARGKSLTDFENFKAKFNQILDGYYPEKFRKQKKEDYSTKIDNNWTDLFWNYKDKTNTIDNPFMRYMYFITEMLYAQNSNISETTSPFVYNAGVPKIDYELILDVYKKKENIDFFFKSLDFWTDLSVTPHEFTTSIFTDKYIEGKVVIFDGKSDLWNRCLTADAFGISEKIILYSLIKYCVDLSNNNVTTDLVEFIRVVRNLLLRIRQARNTKYISDLRFDDIKRRLADICSLLIQKDNVYQILASPGFAMPGFANYSSEVEKAKLIMDNGAFKESIHKLEDNTLLRGCLDNILAIVKENPGFDLNSEITNIWTSDENSLLVQALLTMGDYSVLIGYSALGNRLYFGNLHEWNFILTNTNDEKIKKALKHFFEKYIQASGNTAKEKLEQIIQNFLLQPKKDWKYYFIKYKEFVTGNNVFAWKNEYELRKLNGNSLLTYHINPFVKAVSAIVGNKNICDINNCYGIYGDAAPLRLKNGITLECLKDGWKVKVPDGFIFRDGLEQFNGLVTISNNEFWLKETDGDDRVEIAEKFIHSLSLIK